ncbi:hypothetical protein ACSF64_19840 [Escherichia coli]|uniref:hypothetical protein n=1 Tax=Escherichia coli TaxID=562 RepID=UPI003EE9847E
MLARYFSEQIEKIALDDDWLGHLHAALRKGGRAELILTRQQRKADYIRSIATVQIEPVDHLGLLLLSASR